MKRFYKILCLILVLVATVAAFTVVALADDEATVTKPTPKEKLVFRDCENAEKKPGDVIQNGTSKVGKWNVGEADNGNRYVIASYDSATGSNGDNYENTVPGTTYGIANYPTFAFDFDVLSTTGGFTYRATIRADLYTVNSKGTSVRLTQMKSIKLNADGINVAKVANVWQHVTYVIQYAGDGVFNYYFYVDGVLSETTSVDYNTTAFTSYSTALTAATNWDDFQQNNPKSTLSKTGVYTIIMNPAYSSKTEEIWFDNMQVHYYTDDYSLDDVASYIYNDGYEMPYGFTEAKVDGIVYDDVNKAITASPEDATVLLTKNASKDLIIDKNIRIDTNEYDENGNATGTKYTFEYTSSLGFVGEETEPGSGIFVFKKSENVVDIIWDEACAEGCDCYKEFGGHKMSASTVAVLGNVPEYFGEIPTYEIVNGYEKKFVGWSYTKGAAEPDTLLPITEADVAAGSLNLYPVYKATQYDFAVTKGVSVKYYMETEFATVLNASASGSTVILYDDVTFDHSILIKTGSKVLTLDLNGFKLIRKYTTITTYEAVLDEATGEYVKGDKIGTIKEGRDTTTITTYGGGATLVYAEAIFGVNANSVELNLTSSRPGAEIHAYSVTADRLMLGDEEIRTENVVIGTGLDVIGLYPSAKSTFNIDAKNITFYSGTLFYAEHGGNAATTTVNINGGTYYAIGKVSESVLGIRRGETVNVKDATFYCNGKMLSYATYNNSTTYTFDNCTIYDSIINAQYAKVNYTFNNCKLVDQTYSASGTVYLGEGTVVTKDYTKYKVPAGYVYTTNTDKTYSYQSLVAGVVYDQASGKFVPNMTYGEPVTGSYTYEVKKCSEDENSIKDAQLSMFYYSNFNIALYLPVVEGMTISSVSDFALQDSTVKIGGNSYYVYIKSLTTTGAADTVRTTVSYTAGGKTYKQNFDLSALVYAELILKAPIAEVETNAVANMVRFIKEARTAAKLEVSEKFAELEALAQLDAYKDKAEYDDLDVNCEGLAGTSLAFAVNGNSAAYVIKIPTATFADAENAVITVKYTDGTVLGGVGQLVTETDAEGAEYSYYKFTTNSDRVYNIVEKPIEITITMGETVLTGTYSLGAYIQGTDNALAKAMYEFGVAAKAYREYLETL